jgi:hypothetical protein
MNYSDSESYSKLTENLLLVTVTAAVKKKMLHNQNQADDIKTYAGTNLYPKHTF